MFVLIDKDLPGPRPITSPGRARFQAPKFDSASKDHLAEPGIDILEMGLISTGEICFIPLYGGTSAL